MKKTKVLGKGLAALLGQAKNSFEASSNDLQHLPIESISPNSEQPRKSISQEALHELSISIGQHGVLQPIIVRKLSENSYQIIAGERRWRASQLSGLKSMPAIVKNYDQDTEMQVALVENVQRQNLNPLEEAQGYKALVTRFGYKQDDLARILGKSRSHIANMLRLLSLPTFVQEKLISGEITTGHAKLLLGVKNAAEVARSIIEKKLSVRETEKYLNKQKLDLQRNLTKNVPQQDSELLELARNLSQNLGMNVSIKGGSEGGQVHIAFADMLELDTIISKLER